MNAIEVQKISKFYKEKVVDEIEFTVERGSILGCLDQTVLENQPLFESCPLWQKRTKVMFMWKGYQLRRKRFETKLVM